MAEHSNLFLGVDGGGTGCRVAVADASGAILGNATGGPANVTTDFAEAVSNVRAAIEAAAQHLGDGKDIWQSVAHIGLAGVQTRKIARDVAEALPFEPACTVTEDRETTLAGALGGRDGVFLSIGTGSFAGAQYGAAARFVGGWGAKVGDQASGAWLGRSLLERVLLAHDGLAVHSPLTREVLEQFTGTPSDIVWFAKDADPTALAAIGGRVAKAASLQDGVAVDLMRAGADYLDRCINLLSATDKDPVVIVGGLAQSYTAFLSLKTQARLSTPEGSALDGALLLARRRRT